MSAFMVLFSLFWMSVAFVAAGPFFLFGVFFLAIGLYGLIGVHLVDARRRSRTVYDIVIEARRRAVG
jgi:hypothetical protein